MEMRPCTKCGDMDPFNYYPKGATINGVQYRSYICKPCNAKKTQDCKHNHPEYVKRLRKQMLTRLYAITSEEFDVRSAAQEGRCEICGEIPPLYSV